MVYKDFSDIDNSSINTIRFLSVDMVQKANSGHPGLPAEWLHGVYNQHWNEFYEFNPRDPRLFNRDRSSFQQSWFCLAILCYICSVTICR
jgi:transketolase